MHERGLAASCMVCDLLPMVLSIVTMLTKLVAAAEAVALRSVLACLPAVFAALLAWRNDGNRFFSDENRAHLPLLSRGYTF